MSHTSTRVIASVFAIVVFWSTSTNAEIMYRSSQRGIKGYGIQLVSKQETSNSLDAFEASMLHSNYLRDEDNMIVGHENASVSQNSTLSDNTIRGFGRGSGFGSGGGEGVGTSTMLVEFDIDQAMRFTLTGQLKISPHGDEIGLEGSNASIRLTGPDGVGMEVMMNSENLPDVLGEIDFTGDKRMTNIFPAGSYTLEAVAEGHGSDGKTRCVDFDFTLSALNAVAVPEPSTAALGLFAMLGLAFRRRR